MIICACHPPHNRIHHAIINGEGAAFAIVGLIAALDVKERCGNVG